MLLGQAVTWVSCQLGPWSCAPPFRLSSSFGMVLGSISKRGDDYGSLPKSSSFLVGVAIPCCGLDVLFCMVNYG